MGYTRRIPSGNWLTIKTHDIPQLFFSKFWLEKLPVPVVDSNVLSTMIIMISLVVSLFAIVTVNRSLLKLVESTWKEITNG
jgi:hypothetical protein